LPVHFFAVVRSVQYDSGFFFVCRFDDNIAVGLEGLDGIALCLGDVRGYLVSAADESGIDSGR